MTTIYDASNMTCRDYAKLTLKVFSELFSAKEIFSSIRVPYLSSIAINLYLPRLQNIVLSRCPMRC